ncbi:MAG: hypothetical protein ACKOS8_05330, partial [Gemmataceae bacterium]
MLILGMLLMVQAQTDGAVTWRLQSRSADGKPAEAAVAWDPKKTAVIVCDMWDLHHCLNAVRREKEMAPRAEAFLKAARDKGMLVIHAPS